MIRTYKNNREIKNYKIVVFAENIRSGGGLLLLQDIISKSSQNNTMFLLNEDLRGNINCTNAIFIKNSFFARLGVRLLVGSSDQIHLHFGNLPPIFSQAGKVYVFIQNALYFQSIKIILSQPAKLFFRLLLERIFLYAFLRRRHTVIVQTSYMESLVASNFPNVVMVKSKFMPRIDNFSDAKTKVCDFIFIGGQEKHKNIDVVLSGLADFCEKYEKELTIKITTKIPDALIDYKKHVYLNIIELPNLSHKETMFHLSGAGALIFASSVESLGMPLIEAHALNIDIIAADSEFIAENCCAAEIFVNTSSASLTRALERYFKVNTVVSTTPVAELLAKL